MANQTKQIEQMIYEEDVKPYNEQMTDIGNCGSEIELSLTSSSNVNEPELMESQMTTDTTLAEADSFGETKNDNPTSLKPVQGKIFKENVMNNVANSSTNPEDESNTMLVETIQTEKPTTTDLGSKTGPNLTKSSNVNERESKSNQTTTDTTLAKADSFGNTNNDKPTYLKPEQENIFKENVMNNVTNSSTNPKDESDAILVTKIRTEKRTTTNLNNCSPDTESNSSNNTNEPEWTGNQTTTEITSAKADSFGEPNTVIPTSLIPGNETIFKENVINNAASTESPTNNANELMITDTNQHWIPESTSNIFDRDTLDRIWATLYGQCIGDAIGLLTEFMTLEEAKHYYGKFEKLEYGHKVEDYHRRSWRIGDWTDDSDQMILLMDSLIQDKGQIVPSTFAVKLEDWINYGFTELGDNGGCGFGNLTYTIASQKEFKTSPIQVAEKVWLESGKINAPNGGLMRASIMGIHEFWDTEKVITNTVQMCKVTHFDPRCQASVAAFCSAISMMLNKEHLKDGNFDVEEIVRKSFNYGCRYLQGHEKTITEFESYIYCTDIKSLNLDDTYSIGYTFKCLGAGFWAFRQNDFRAALQEITMQAGDSDTNGAVAGALLACKLGTKCLPESWKNKLCHHQWLENKIKSYIELIALTKRKTMV